jgi:hypothetical protein
MPLSCDSTYTAWAAEAGLQAQQGGAAGVAWGCQPGHRERQSTVVGFMAGLGER